MNQTTTSMMSSDMMRFAFLMIAMTLSIEFGSEVVTEFSEIIQSTYEHLNQWLIWNYQSVYAYFPN